MSGEIKVGSFVIPLQDTEQRGLVIYLSKDGRRAAVEWTDGLEVAEIDALLLSDLQLA